MENTSDRALDYAVKFWEDGGFEDEDCYYPGTTEEIAAKRSTFIQRSKWLFDRMMSIREQRNRANERDLENKSKPDAQYDMDLSKEFTTERQIRQGILDGLRIYGPQQNVEAQNSQDTKRAAYLLAALQQRGLKWAIHKR
ncbi:MAG: hypothetical protein Q9180_006868 [Flavoplaca navasiana]